MIAIGKRVPYSDLRIILDAWRNGEKPRSLRMYGVGLGWVFVGVASFRREDGAVDRCEWPGMLGRRVLSGLCRVVGSAVAVVVYLPAMLVDLLDRAERRLR